MLDVGGSGGDGRGGPDPRLYLAAYGQLSLSGKPIGDQPGQSWTYTFQPVAPFRPLALWVWPAPGTLPIVEQIQFGCVLQLACEVPAHVLFAPLKPIAQFVELLHRPPDGDPCLALGHALTDWPDRPAATVRSIVGKDERPPPPAMPLPFGMLMPGEAAQLRISAPVLGFAFWGEALLPAAL